MKPFFLKLLSVFLSLLLLGACAGSPQFQKQEKDPVSFHPTPAKVQETQKKALPSNPLDSMFACLSESFYHHTTVLPAHAKGVREAGINCLATGYIWDIIKVALGVRRFIVNRWWDDAMFDR